ncbi:hypothetical protein X755_32835 [Mesorhizobium sp. LNJC405B00]|nr:hypothetical protein X755_32835 [Mesorhizobium sp. LNJC405B00]
MSDELALGGFDRKAEAGLQHIVLVGDVMAEMPKRLFDATGIQRMQAAKFQADIRPRFIDRLEDMGRLVGRNIKFPAEFADIGDAVGTGEAHADLDLLEGAEWIVVVGEIVGADFLDQLSRIRTHQAEHGLSCRDIGDDYEFIPDMPAQPGEVALQRRARHDEEVGGLR